MARIRRKLPVKYRDMSADQKRVYANEHYRKNREKICERHRRRYDANKDRLRPKQADYSRKTKRRHIAQISDWYITKVLGYPPELVELKRLHIECKRALRATRKK